MNAYEERRRYDEQVMVVMDQLAFAEGSYDDGVRHGMKAGMEKGMKKGMKEGMEKGLMDGKNEGLAEGLAKGKTEGLAEGLAKGKSEEKLSLARIMKQEGEPIEKIARYTGLDISEIESLTSPHQETRLDEGLGSYKRAIERGPLKAQ